MYTAGIYRYLLSPPSRVYEGDSHSSMTGKPENLAKSCIRDQPGERCTDNASLAGAAEAPSPMWQRPSGTLHRADLAPQRRLVRQAKAR